MRGHQPVKLGCGGHTGEFDHGLLIDRALQAGQGPSFRKRQLTGTKRRPNHRKLLETPGDPHVIPGSAQRHPTGK